MTQLSEHQLLGLRQVAQQEWNAAAGPENQWVSLAQEVRDGQFIKILARELAEHAIEEEPSFQKRVTSWIVECFGPGPQNILNRAHRFLEEAIEAFQAAGGTKADAHQLVDYVFGRPVGIPSQEAGGVMVTFAALCEAQNLSMYECGKGELKRVWSIMPAIRAKNASAAPNSPIPGQYPSSTEVSAYDPIDGLLESMATHGLLLSKRDNGYWAYQPNHPGILSAGVHSSPRAAVEAGIAAVEEGKVKQLAGNT